jgi:hypothetical protein
MRKVLAVSILLCSQTVWAQGPSVRNGENEILERRVQQDAFEKWATDPNGAKKDEVAREAAAAAEFYGKAKHFVDLWQAFTDELNNKKTFNAKLAKELAKAFHSLEKSDGWPVGRVK